LVLLLMMLRSKGVRADAVRTDIVREGGFR
jgi:hypothetical protein